MPNNSKKNKIDFRKDLSSREDIIKEFYSLIDNVACNEMSVKPFLEHYTNMIPTPFELNHGINFNFILPQFSVSTAFKCDFFYLTKSTTTWWCVFVEIESPNAQIFQKEAKNVRRHSDFSQAIDQIESWKRYLSDHKSELLDRIAPLMTHLTQNPIQFKFVTVIGRRKQFEGDIEKVKAYSTFEVDVQNDKMVMTYDALISAAQNGRWREYNLLSPVGHKFQFKKLVPQPSNIWTVFSPDILQLSNEQKILLKDKGVAIDAWSNGKKLGNFGIATEAELDDLMSKSLNQSMSKKGKSN